MLKYECEGEFEWTHIKFSPNGKMILVSTNTSLILLVDAFSGVLLHTFTVMNEALFYRRINQSAFFVFRDIRIRRMYHSKLPSVLIPNTSFAVGNHCDERFEISIIPPGSTDGRIHVWRTNTGEKLTTLTTDNSSDCIQTVQFNPKSFMLASASSNMVRQRTTLSHPLTRVSPLLDFLAATGGR